MDQATFTNQGILWNIGKRRKNTNLDSNLSIRVDCFGEKKLNLDITLYTFLQILNVSVFEQVDILQLVKNFSGMNQNICICNQWNLFDL